MRIGLSGNTEKSGAIPVTVKSGRLWEVDTLRGVAIVMMVFYHFMWDLYFFELYQGNVLAGPWQTFARGIATTFIFVMGISLTLSYQRELRQTQPSSLFNKYLWRGLKVFGWGLVITVATYFFIGRGFVIFGILHLIGLSIILAYPFLTLNRWFSLLAGLAAIGLGIFFDSWIVEFPWLIWLGIKQAGRAMVDYYPFLPWFGVALIGIFAGHTLYPQGNPKISWPDLRTTRFVRGLRFLGQHSLLIYLIHQPILIGIFLALGFRP
jgi:uncharacterized membrane protein